MRRSELGSFFEPGPKNPSTNAPLNQNNESREQSQSMCNSCTSINTSNIVSTRFIEYE